MLKIVEFLRKSAKNLSKYQKTLKFLKKSKILIDRDQSGVVYIYADTSACTLTTQWRGVPMYFHKGLQVSMGAPNFDFAPTLTQQIIFQCMNTRHETAESVFARSQINVSVFFRFLGPILAFFRSWSKLTISADSEARYSEQWFDLALGCYSRVSEVQPRADQPSSDLTEV
jgi:hypothetical protein